MSVNLFLPQEAMLAILRWYDAYLDKIASGALAFGDEDHAFNKNVKDILYNIVREQRLSNIISPGEMKVKLTEWLLSEDFLTGLYKNEMNEADLYQNIKTSDQQQGDQFPNDLLFNYDGGIFYDLFSYRSNDIPEALEQLGNFLHMHNYDFDHNLSWQMAIFKDHKI